MNLNWIKTEWQEQVANKELQKTCWDRFAPEFAAMTEKSAEQSKAFRIVTEQRMFDANASVLDLGCGAGRFSEVFAGLCREVTGADLSEEMIRFAKERQAEKGLDNITYRVMDWHEADLGALGWEKKFDLVFACNTPAVQSYQTFQKMNQASKGWCFLAKPIRWQDSLIMKLVRAVGLEDRYRTFDDDMMYAYDVLLQAGYFPMVDYDSSEIVYEDTVENAFVHFRNRIGMKCALTKEQEDRILKELNTMATDGIIKECWKNTIAILYWNTNRRDNV